MELPPLHKFTQVAAAFLKVAIIELITFTVLAHLPFQMQEMRQGLILSLISLLQAAAVVVVLVVVAQEAIDTVQQQ